MRRITHATLALALVLMLAQAPPARARQGGSAQAAPQAAPHAGGDRYQFGDRSVRIPAPEGFAEASSQIPLIKETFESSEAPTLEVLAVHLPADLLEQLKRGARQPLKFYTKVSAPRQFKGVDISASDFADVVATFEQQQSQIFDMNSPEMKATLEGIEKRLAEVNGHATQMTVSVPVNLGVIEKGSDRFIAMIVISMRTQESGRAAEMPLLTTLSLLRVNQRLIFVYAYREYHAKEDVGPLKDFTQKWVNQIIAANPR